MAAVILITSSSSSFSSAVVVRKPQRNHGWRKVLDPSAHQLYNWKESTGEMAWERPAVTGPGPALGGSAEAAPDLERATS